MKINETNRFKYWGEQVREWEAKKLLQVQIKTPNQQVLFSRIPLQNVRKTETERSL